MKDSLNSMLNGTWELEGHIVVFTPFNGGRPSRYAFEAIQYAINNVERSRSTYATEEAWSKVMDHFEHGRSLFPVSHLPKPTITKT